MQKWLEKINKKSHKEREVIALSLSLFLTVIIVGVSVGVNMGGVRKNTKNNQNIYQVANVAEAVSVGDSTSVFVGSTFKEVKKIISETRQSIENVFVPFVTGIEMYERE